MEIHYLKYFYEVAKNKSFTLAARKLHVSQPSVSKAVKHLEESLNESLINRKTKGLFELTAAGEQVFLRASVIFENIEKISTGLKEAAATLSGELKIGASDHISSYLLPTFLKDFSKKNPQVDIKVWSGPSSAIKDRMVQGTTEIGLFLNDSPHLQIENLKLRPEKFYLVSDRSLSFEQVQNLSFIGCTSADFYQTYPALEMLNKLKIKPKRFIECNSFEAQKSLIKSGMGYAIFPEFAIAPELKSGDIVRIKTPTDLHKNLVLAARKGRTLSKVADAFKGFLQQNL